MIEFVIDQRRRDLGGFEVGRLLPYGKRRMIGPFIFFDHMGPADFAPGVSKKLDVRPHPHIGLSTITYLFDGEIMHRDSVGSVQPIRAGEVNWMTAGRGVTHSERFERARLHGDRIHGVQAWVALPQADEEMDPAFSHHAMEDLPLFGEGGMQARLIAGKAFGVESKIKTRSPMFYLHCTLEKGRSAGLVADYPERAVYVVSGEVEVEGRSFGAGKMIVFTRGGAARLTALQPCVLMLLGGEPVGERLIEWNFVASSRERIDQAKADWRAGRMKLPDADDQEFIPLPPDPAPPAEPMS